MRNVDIQALQPEQLPLLASLIQWHDPLSEEKRLAEAISREEMAIHGVFVDGQLIACVRSLLFSDDEVRAIPGQRVGLDLLAVLPPCRGQGYEAALIRYVMNAWSLLGIREVTASVLSDDAPARALFQGLGFTRSLGQFTELRDGMHVTFDLYMACLSA